MTPEEAGPGIAAAFNLGVAAATGEVSSENLDTATVTPDSAAAFLEGLNFERIYQIESAQTANKNEEE